MADMTGYKKTRDFLVCVDSDGCAMDTMDIKHYRAFGPCLVDCWELSRWRDEILARWNDINLYSTTRGINRFKGLAKALSEINEKYVEIADLSDLVSWVESADELSSSSLEGEIANKSESDSLKKALLWSAAVNEAIKGLPTEEIKPFPLVKEALAYAHEKADIAIVSGANLGAVMDEWTRHGLLEYADIVMAQDSGSKESCISALLTKGYSPRNVIMCGDAPGDLAAAEKNGVYFYPILARHEEQSWREFIDSAFSRLTEGSYGEGYAEQKKTEFIDNLKQGE